MTTLFISDLHLDASRPDITGQFVEFLREQATGAEFLYILGDLFEAWVGDDDPEPEKQRAVAALRALSDSGVPVYFMHGNRDFLIGARFAREAGCTLLPDPCRVSLHGSEVLLMHGDTLCTDDVEYQAFREMTRDPSWQQQFLSLPLAQRLAMAEEARAESLASTRGKPESIMDVNQQAVVETMREEKVRLLLHGHTHRPAVHDFEIDGRAAQRIVLGDWYTQGSVVYWDDSGFRLESLPRTEGAH
ncbi:MAG: UDP-2,3-diacylglucosamine diphosphatase [Gammaproteobacteria bacterium]|nr:UDP-2,3-diacylglucosamine diphosphatase [Gammaproteobacteria bacterium]